MNSTWIILGIIYGICLIPSILLTKMLCEEIRGSPKDVCILGMTPTTSTTVMTVIGDILVVQTMQRTGFTIEDYSKRHPFILSGTWLWK